uniref:uncharacterized protein LOC122610991 n=1 Tax=Erigeron canadensis TaxID=72917 RepID=UPI001CB95904|nr:uncharacterized protein LOC122610991 [Erigeron canadensis]
MDFSTKQAWEDLRIDNPSVGWCKVVWFNQMAGPDSHEHLFFQCPYTMEIWDCMRKMTNLQNVSYRMDNSVQEIAEKKVQNNIGMVVCKLVLVASVYYIWQERNYRLLKKRERYGDELCKSIKYNVRLKMLALKVKKSINMMIMVDKWDLCWKKNSLFAI